MRNLIFGLGLLLVSAGISAQEFWVYSKDGTNLILGVGVGAGGIQTVLVMDNHRSETPLRFEVKQLKFTLENGLAGSPCCAVADNYGRLDLPVSAGGAAFYYIVDVPNSMSPFDKQQILLTLKGSDDPWVAALGGVGLTMEQAVAKLGPLYFGDKIKEVALGSDIKFKRATKAEVEKILEPLKNYSRN